MQKTVLLCSYSRTKKFLFCSQNTACKGQSQQQHYRKRGNYMCNKDIREYAQRNNVKLWQIANELHINDGNFSRKLRVELTEDKKQEIRKIIDALANK